MTTIDYYVILGLEHSATPEAIKQSRRRLARKWHPDVNKSPEAGARFVEAQQAYEVLINPQKRATYDSLIANGRRPTSDHFRSERTSTRRDSTVDFEEILRDLHRQRTTSQRQTRTKTIDDFVADAERYASVGMMSSATQTYRTAEQFAGSQPDQVTAEKLRKMKYSVLDGYASQVQLSISGRMMSSATQTYRTAEQFAGNDQDKGILMRLENMKKMIKR